MDYRKLVYVLAGLLVIAVAAFGWSLTRGYENKKEEVRENALVTAEPEAEQICASRATYARLKEVAFEDAIRLRGADTASLDTLAASSVVRMETPLVLNRDEQLNVTVCSGRFILELPPGSEAAFGGERRLSAEIEYSAQAAADGSGLVYEIRGAEPIVQRLAAFNPGGQPVRTAGASPGGDQFARAAPAPVPPQPAVRPQPVVRPQPSAPRTPPRPVERAAPPEPQRTRPAGGRPSFSCRQGRSRSEQMVCSSGQLSALDRDMSSQFFSAMAEGNGRTRAELRRSRDRFLAFRERCRSEACVAGAYRDRMREIRDIMAETD